MREYAKKPERVSRTLDSKPKASGQAPISEILQTKKEDTLERVLVSRNDFCLSSKKPVRQLQKIDGSGQTVQLDRDWLIYLLILGFTIILLGVFLWKKGYLSFRDSKKETAIKAKVQDKGAEILPELEEAKKKEDMTGHSGLPDAGKAAEEEARRKDERDKRYWELERNRLAEEQQRKMEELEIKRRLRENERTEKKRKMEEDARRKAEEAQRMQEEARRRGDEERLLREEAQRRDREMKQPQYRIAYDEKQFRMTMHLPASGEYVLPDNIVAPSNGPHLHLYGSGGCVLSHVETRNRHPDIAKDRYYIYSDILAAIDLTNGRGDLERLNLRLKELKELLEEEVEKRKLVEAENKRKEAKTQIEIHAAQQEVEDAQRRVEVARKRVEDAQKRVEDAQKRVDEERKRGHKQPPQKK